MKTSILTLQSAQRNSQSSSWSKLVSVYTPLISGWMRRCGVSESDVSDLTQEVLVALVDQLPKFDHNGRVGAFRRWLKLITVNHCRRYWERSRKRVPLDKNNASGSHLNELADPSSGLSRRWDREHDLHVMQGILQLIRLEFDSRTMSAFRRSTFGGESPASIAKDLGVSVGQIYKFRFRVMERLREEAAGLLEAERYRPNESDTLKAS